MYPVIGRLRTSLCFVILILIEIQNLKKAILYGQ